jgi:hypothetical protein
MKNLKIVEGGGEEDEKEDVDVDKLSVDDMKEMLKKMLKN